MPYPPHDYPSHQPQPLPQFPPQSSTIQIQPPPPVISKYERNGDGVNSLDYQNRLETRSNNVGKLVGEIGVDKDEDGGVLRGRKSTQDSVKWFTDERKKTINVADDHVR